MWRHIKDNCKPTLETRTSFEAWQAVENIYWVIMYASIIEVYSKIHDQQSETYKIKAALITIIQQTIYKYCKIADVNSSYCIRKEKSLIFYWTLDSKFYHLKKQIKIMKKSDIDSKKMRSLINSHSIQTVKSSALTVILSIKIISKNQIKKINSKINQIRDNESNWTQKHII